MKFDVETFARVANKASEKLQKRTLGGVEKESALKAIEDAAQRALNLGEEAVGKVQQELNTFKNKTAQEMAEMTSKNDKLVLETKQEAKKLVEEAAAKAGEAVKKAKAIKTFEKVLPNGNKEIRKANKNGATMVKTVNPEGKTVQVEVTTLAGDYKKTTYDAVTGKPVKTFTNTGGDKLITYDENGKSINQLKVNTKKVKGQRPAFIGDPKVTSKESRNGISIIETEQKMSDGSLMKRELQDGQIISEYKSFKDHWNGPKEERHISMDSKIGGARPKGTVSYYRDGIKKDYVSFWDPNIINVFPSGHRSYSRIIKDPKLGIELSEYKINFPKSSEFKKYIETKPNGAERLSAKAKLEMKNGEVYEIGNFAKQGTNDLTKFNGLEIFVPTNVTKIAKDGTTTQMPQEEIRTWLESFHPDFNFHLRAGK